MLSAQNLLVVTICIVPQDLYILMSPIKHIFWIWHQGQTACGSGPLQFGEGLIVEGHQHLQKIIPIIGSQKEFMQKAM